MNNFINYEGKKVVVTGAASGMGEAATKLLLELGAEVYALDIQEPKLEVHKYIKINLGDKESIDNALKQLPEKIDTIFNCAGIAGTNDRFSTLDVLTINFIGPKYLIESLIPRMTEESSIAIIASCGGMNWAEKIDKLTPLVQTESFEEGQELFLENEETILDGYELGDASYMVSKEAMILWMKQKAYGLSEKQIRINTVSPAATATPMSAEFEKVGKGLSTAMLSKVGYPATPEDQGKALIFLGSDLASYVSGQDLQVDYAYTAFGVHGFK